MNTGRSCWAIAMLVAAFASAPIGAKEITLPIETTFLIPDQTTGYAYASAMCATCHSADYIQHQPPAMPLTFWKSEVLKMRKTYGAPLPDAAIDPIADYLARTYGADKGKS